MRILDVKNLQVKFGDFQAVKDSSFFVEQGKVSAIVGESGSGKSVSCLSLLRLMNGVTVRGKAKFNKVDLLKLSEDELVNVRGRDISFIFQEPMTSLNPLHSIGKQIKEVLIIHGIVENKKQANKKVDELLELVGLKYKNHKSKIINLKSRYPHQLSGGQRQRVMIAMAIACQPDLLIADEPTTALDVTIQQEILDLLKELQDKLGLSILLITHDLNLVKHFADDIFVMNHGVIVESGGKELFANSQHEYTKKLLKASELEIANKKEKKVCHCEEYSDAAIQGGENKAILEVKNISLEYDNKFLAVDNVSFSVNAGETLGIIGESGSGKTSIVNAILRLISIKTGKIILNNKELQDLNEKQLRPLRKDIQVVFQDPFSTLSPRMTVEQILEEPLKIHKIGNKAERTERVMQALQEVGLIGDIIDNVKKQQLINPISLPLGERQRERVQSTKFDLVRGKNKTETKESQFQGVSGSRVFSVKKLVKIAPRYDNKNSILYKLNSWILRLRYDTSVFASLRMTYGKKLQSSNTKKTFLNKLRHSELGFVKIFILQQNIDTESSKSNELSPLASLGRNDKVSINYKYSMLNVLNRYPHEFSGGQRQRIAIARALILNPKLIILDEPTSALDVCVQADILALLQNIQRDKHIAYIFVSHDLKVIKNSADYVMVLKNGRIVEKNKSMIVFSQPVEKYTKKLIDSM